MELYGVEWSGKAYRGAGKHGQGSILWNRVQESFETLEMVDGEQYFQQDNDLKHMSGLATQ
jgi:hypothetical protein